jgi:hypothetical protein
LAKGWLGAAGGRAGTQHLRRHRRHLLQFLAAVITVVGPRDRGTFPGRLGGRRELRGKLLAIVLVGNHIRLHDQAVLLIDHHLAVVAGVRALAAAHRRTVRVGEIDPRTVFFLQLLQGRGDPLLASPLRGPFLLEMNQRLLLGLLGIDLLALVENPLDPLVDPPEVLLALGGRPTLVVAGVGAELAAVDEPGIAGDHAELEAQTGTVPQHPLESLAILPPKAGDGLEIRLQTSGQPDKGEIMAQRAFELPRAANPVGVTLDEDLEHDRGRIGRTADLGRIGFDAQAAPIERVHKGIVGPHGIIRGDELLNGGGQEHLLIPRGLPKRHRGTPFQDLGVHDILPGQKRKTLSVGIVTQSVRLRLPPRL